MIGFAIAVLLIDHRGSLLLQKVGFVGMTVGMLIVAFGTSGGEGNENIPLILIDFALFNVLVQFELYWKNNTNIWLNK